MVAVGLNKIHPRAREAAIVGDRELPREKRPTLHCWRMPLRTPSRGCEKGRNRVI
jgi:hypothetical protein